MTEERRVQLVAEVDTTRTRAGFQEIGQQAGQMAQQVTQAGERAERAVSGVGSGAATSSRNVDAASRSIIGSIQRTTVAMEAGGRATSQYYELLARQRGIDPNVVTPYINALRNVEQAQTRTGASTAQVANAMRMVPAQLSDIAVQLAGGQSPFMVLLQQGSQLRDSFGSIPATIRGVGTSLLGLINPYTVAAGAAAALAYAYNEGSKEADGFNRALILSGNIAGTSAEQMAMMAKAISELGGTQSGAAAALSALAATGKVGAENLQGFATTAINVQKRIGQSVDETAKQFAELGKSPVEASQKLNEAYHYLTASVLEQIKALQEQGRLDEAGALAQKTYANAFDQRTHQLTANLGVVERAWESAGNFAKRAWDKFLNIGRKDTIEDELSKIDEQLEKRKSKFSIPVPNLNRIARLLAGTPDLSDLTEDELKQKRAALEMQKQKRDWDAAQAGIAQQMNDMLLQWNSDGDKFLTNIQKRDKEIAKVRQEGLAAGISDDEINKRVAKIYANYASTNNPLLAKLEGDRVVARELLARQLDDLETSHKLQIISEDEYIREKARLQAKELDGEIAVLRQRKAIDAGKEDKSAFQKDEADLRAAIERRLNILRSADNAIRVAENARSKAVDGLVAGWDRAIASETEAVSQELTLFGQSGTARQVAIEQIKLEIDARKFVDDQKKAGHALNEQELADLKARTKARQDDIAVAMYQRAAIRGAEQLLEANRKFSVEYIADAEVRARRLLDIDARQWRELIANAAEGSEARQKLIEQFDQWYANRQMAPVLDRWKSVIDNLDNNFHEGFRDMLTNGQNTWSSFAKSISNTLKTSLADALYQTFIKKYVVQIVAGFAGALSGPAVAGALTGTAPAPGSVSAGPVGLAQTASSLYSAVTGGFEKMGAAVTSGIDAALGQVGPGTIGSTGSSAIASTAGQVIPYVAAAVASYYISKGIAGGYKVEGIGTALNYAGVVGGLINRAFGMGSKETTSQGISGTLSASGLNGQSYSTWHQDGGWFRSDKNGTDTKALTDAMVKQFTQGLAAIESASTGFASALGVQSDFIKDYTKTFDIKLTGDQAKDQQAITDFFQGIGDEIAGKLVPNLNDFNKSGETLSATLQRLAGDFQGTDKVAQLLGFSAETLFGAAGLGGAKAREQLIDLAGGISVLSSQAASFNQNFLSDAERIKPVAEALDKALASLGLRTIPTTRDEFKALVNDLISSGAAASASGAKQLDSLLALAEAFAQVHPAADAAAEAVDKAAAAMQAVKDQASAMLGGVNDAYSALQKVVSREKSAIQASVDSHTAAFNKLQSLSQALHSTLDSLKSPDQKAFERAAGQAQIRAALAIAKAGGPLPDSEKLKGALGAVTQDASGQFSNFTDYMRDLLQTQNDVAQLAGLTDDSLSVEQKSLDALNQQLKRLDEIVGNGQLQIDALNGQSVATLSLAQAMAALQSSIGSAQTNPVVAGTSSVASLYQDLLGRAPDQAGMQYWQGILAGGTSLDKIRSFFMDSDEYKKLHPFAVGTNFVPETMPALVHQGERIIPAADNRVLMSVLARAGGGDSAALVAEVKALRETVAKQQAALDRIANDTREHKNMFEQATAGGGPLQVEVVQ